MSPRRREEHDCFRRVSRAHRSAGSPDEALRNPVSFRKKSTTRPAGTFEQDGIVGRNR